MREIKFKAYAKAYNKIVNVDRLGLNSDGTAQEIIVTERELGEYDSDEWTDLQVGEFELLQYAGVNDRNGTEIYEGDIVKFDPQSPCGDEFYNPRDGEIGEVIFDFGSFVVKPIDKRREDLRFSLSELGDWVVVGNIYENPELLQ